MSGSVCGPLRHVCFDLPAAGSLAMGHVHGPPINGARPVELSTILSTQITFKDTRDERGKRGGRRLMRGRILPESRTGGLILCEGGDVMGIVRSLLMSCQL